MIAGFYLISGSGRDLYIVQTVDQAAYALAGDDDYASVRGFALGSDRIALGSGSYRLANVTDGAGIFDGQELVDIVEGFSASQLDINDESVFIKNY